MTRYILDICTMLTSFQSSWFVAMEEELKGFHLVHRHRTTVSVNRLVNTKR